MHVLFSVVDDASDVFLPLPSDVTTNESADCSTALCVPLEAEPCGTHDWLESTDQSPQHLRADTPLQTQSELQISTDALSLTHESLCDTDTVAPLTAADVSLMPRSPLKTAPDLTPSQEVTSHCTLTELLERAEVECFCNDPKYHTSGVQV